MGDSVLDDLEKTATMGSESKLERRMALLSAFLDRFGVSTALVTVAVVVYILHFIYVQKPDKDQERQDRAKIAEALLQNSITQKGQEQMQQTWVGLLGRLAEGQDRLIVLDQEKFEELKLHGMKLEAITRILTQGPVRTKPME